MEIVKKKRTMNWVVTILTIGLVIILLTTYKLDQEKNNWVSGPALLIIELIIFSILGILTFIIWKTENTIIKVIITVISLGLITFIIWNLINFITKCS